MLKTENVSAQNTVDRLVKTLLSTTSEKQLALVDSIVLDFPSYHTQGLTKVGSHYFLTAVKIKRWPQKYPTPVDKFDRDTGEGKGFLFKFDENGKLIGKTQIGEGSSYHPGGIDFDGNYIWIPVCEYRP